MKKDKNTDDPIVDKKKKFAFYTTESTLDLVQQNFEEDDCSCMSEYITKAIHYYAELHSLKDCSNVIPDIITSTLKDITRESDNRQGRLLFRIAVELTILQNIIAAEKNISVAELDRVRGVCVNEVKKLNGIISFEEAVRWQS